MEVNTFWHGSRFSPVERLAAVSHLNHGHRFVLWTYSMIGGVPDGVEFADARKVLPESELFSYQVGEGRGSYSAFSNYFRYKLLLDRGGWWTDTDVICVKPWNFPGEHVIASERTEDNSSVPATCVLKMPADSQLAWFCWNACQRANKATLRWGEVGCELLAKGIAAVGLWGSVVTPETFCPIDWFRFRDLFVTGDVLKSHGLHLWNEMWRRHGVDKWGNFPADSLYETIRRDTLHI